MMFTPPVVPPDSGSRAAHSFGVLPTAISAAFGQWAESESITIASVEVSRFNREDLLTAKPSLIIFGAEAPDAVIRSHLQTLKRDARLQTTPTVVVAPAQDAAVWFEAGADEVLAAGMPDCEVAARLSAAVRRTRRDVQVNPSTGLVGGDAISAAINLRLSEGALFAACYADLDHFKEFNDRYGYGVGDAVIRTVAGLLVEVVEATAGADGFVGHIGGDDFLFLVPLDVVVLTCETLVRRADEILTGRYSAHDRQAGYFFGKDRRGRLDRVPLMTLSIGVVTNERRRFSHAAQVSELATEMKTYAKTLPGSVWAMDRRSDGESANTPEEKHQ